MVLRDLHFSEHQHWNHLIRMLLNKITTLKVSDKLKKQEDWTVWFKLGDYVMEHELRI
jgi:hypothetical protein